MERRKYIMSKPQRRREVGAGLLQDIPVNGWPVSWWIVDCAPLARGHGLPCCMLMMEKLFLSSLQVIHVNHSCFLYKRGR